MPDPTFAPASKGGRWRRLARTTALAAAMALTAFGSLFFAAAAQFAPGGSPKLVAVFPPWWSGARALVAAADVAPVAGVGAAGFVVGVVADRPGVAAALRARGALFVADGAVFPACFSPPRKIP